MKNNEMNESKIDVVNSGYDFEGFGDDLYDDFVNSEESQMEPVNIENFDFTKIDTIVKSGDYLGLKDYLDELNDDQKVEANEYIHANFPEFLQDEEGSVFEPMKGNTGRDKELFDNLDNKTHINRINIKDELGKALVNSYKNAA